MLPARMIGREVRTVRSPSTGLEIPVIAADGMVFSAWTPSPEEVERINKGQAVWLIQRGPSIPEMTMIVGEKNEVIPSHILVKAINDPTDKLDQSIVEHSSEMQKNYVQAWWIVRGLILVVGIISCYLVLRLLR